MDKKELEIMAPAGSFDCLRAAIQGGADSVYFGVGKLNMRSHSANNFAPGDLPEVTRICREAGVKSYLTLNICLYPEDIPDMQKALDAAKDAGVNAIIASDMAAIAYCRQIGLEVHISTQLSISNVESLRFYARFADVVVLARELNLDQVKDIHDAIVRENICGPSGKPVRIEMFAHGALCMAISGKCYLSLHAYGQSANRGACYQICRRGYEVTDLETGNQLEIDNKYIMSPKDLCTVEFMERIIASGVRVFKIEGRARSAEYVKRCAQVYRQAADAVCDGVYTPEMAAGLKARLGEVFNRGFWDGYYQGAYLG
ncbi:MAG: U32 family peptidase, partial [Bacteroidales bacterium]|nr:U32 family peptidase [Bacteroidales bacterium]